MFFAKVAGRRLRPSGEFHRYSFGRWSLPHESEGLCVLSDRGGLVYGCPCQAIKMTIEHC